MQERLGIQIGILSWYWRASSDFSENNKPQPPKSPTSLKIHSLYLELNFTVVSQKLLNYNLMFFLCFSLFNVFLFTLFSKELVMKMAVLSDWGDYHGQQQNLKLSNFSEVNWWWFFSLFCKYMIFCKVCSTLLHRKLE